MTPQDLIARFLADRETLIATAPPGLASARRLSDLADQAVGRVAESALSGLRNPWSVLAVGGWGSRRLLPGSDLDLLVVTDAPAPALRPALETMLYPLWDAGVSVGHKVTSRRDHARAVREDTQALTATLTGRVLAGDASAGERILGETASGARRRSKRLLAELASRDRPGSPYLLEPDIKEGAGGQRDLDEMVWTAAVLSGAPAHDLSPLVHLGLLAADDVSRLQGAAGLIASARWLLQREGFRPRSLLTLEAAEDTGLDAQALQASLADVHHTLLRLRKRVSAKKPEEVRGNHIGPDELFALLDLGESGLADLEDAAWSGRLDDIWPGLAEIMPLRRPSMMHVYTLGAHSLRCAALIASLPPHPPRSGPLPDLRILQAAALFHDAGKVQTGPSHAKRGSNMAETLLPRLGFDAQRTREGVLLVREHLLLAETAATEDIHDEDVLLRRAQQVERPDLVAALYLLTEADSMATGPTAWNSWHQALVGELADRLQAALADEEGGGTTWKRAQRVRREALRLLPPEAPDAAVCFVRDAHLRYLTSQRPRDVADQAMLASGIVPSDGQARMAVSEGPAQHTWRVTVAAPDAPGLFASIAGALALAGLDILSADAFLAPGSVALDVFVVRSDTLAEVDAPTWASFETHLSDAIRDRPGFEERLAERRRAYPVKSRIEAVVSTEEAASYATAVHVSATDRVGLLYDLACAISEAGLDIKWARATTRGTTVRDVFHVVDAFGEPVGDPGLLGHLAMRIRERA